MRAVPTTAAAALFLLIGLAQSNQEDNYPESQQQQQQQQQQQTATPTVGAWPPTDVRTNGEVWPQPASITYTGHQKVLSSAAFRIVTNITCDIVKAAIARYGPRIVTTNSSVFKHQTSRNDEKTQLTYLRVDVIDETCPKSPQFGDDEEYTIEAFDSRSFAVLQANTVWGVVRGLETFSQLVYEIAGSGGKRQLVFRTAIVRDKPRFAHRGVLLDTSRHYLSLNLLKSAVDLMSQNKFNVFHWHIVDNEAFPLILESYPELATRGAYSSKHTYTIADVKELVAYARLRGVRVLLELDTPGHVQSWGKGVPDLVSRCFDNVGAEVDSRAILDPTRSNTFDVLVAVFRELFAALPDAYFHLGGDEVEYWQQQCWLNNKNVTDFMKLYGLKDVNQLEQWYFDRLLELLNGPYIPARDRKRFVVWQEVLDSDLKLPSAVAHVWRGDHQKELARVTKNQHLAILSSCWYLDYVASKADWMDYYACDPHDFNGTDRQKSLVLGGEAALWGEWVDETNLIARLFPRASAVAEVLWSPKQARPTKPEAAWPRLYSWACRQVQRGYPVQPGYGPGYCPYEYRVNLPF